MMYVLYVCCQLSQLSVVFHHKVVFLFFATERHDVSFSYKKGGVLVDDVTTVIRCYSTHCKKTKIFQNSKRRKFLTQRKTRSTMTAKGRLLVLGSVLQRVSPIHSWGKCASSVAFDAHSTSVTTAHHRNFLRKGVNADKQSPQASGGTPPLNDIPRRRRVLEARGVSVVYQRSATAEYRRRGDPALGITRSAVTSKPGGSVVVRMGHRMAPDNIYPTADICSRNYLLALGFTERNRTTPPAATSRTRG